MINVFIIDDHPFILEGVVASLEPNNYKIRIIGKAQSYNELLVKMRPEMVDIILLDLKMPEVDGLECYKRIKEKHDDIKFIALTGELDTHLLLDAWLLGINAIMPKYCNKDELLRAIKRVNEGERMLGAGLPDIFKSASIARDENVPKLTKREEEILKLLATGMTRKAAAEHLNISVDSVKFHCKNLFKKFGKNKLDDVIIEAREYRIIP